MTLTGGQPARTAVCTQAEWDALERTRPGRHTLVRAGLGSEGAAEQLARALQTPPGPPEPAAARRPHRKTGAAG